MQRRWLPFFSAVLLSVPLTGCIDVLHYVSKEQTEQQTRLEILVRATVQKRLIEAALAMDGDANGPTDRFYEEELGFGAGQQELLEEYPDGIDVEYTPINDELEYGFAWRISADVDSRHYQELEAEFAPFVPFQDDDKIVIRLPNLGVGAPQHEMAGAALAGARYRLLLARSFADSIVRAIFVSGPKSRTVNLTRLPDLYLVELPMSYWLQSVEDCRLILRQSPEDHKGDS